MMSVDDILRGGKGIRKADLKPVERARMEDLGFSVAKYRKANPCAEFGSKEERERWGGRLPSTERGYSGRESGTREVIRSMNFDSSLGRLDEKMRRERAKDADFYQRFVGETLGILVRRFNADGEDKDWDAAKVASPCLTLRESYDVVRFASKREWAKDVRFRSLVVAALGFVVRHGDFKAHPKDCRMAKGRLVEAYHRMNGWKAYDTWWTSAWEARKARGEIPAARRSAK